MNSQDGKVNILMRNEPEKSKPFNFGSLRPGMLKVNDEQRLRNIMYVRGLASKIKLGL